MGHIFGFSTTLQNSAVAFGRFDGMHIGHRKVIRKLASYEKMDLSMFVRDIHQIEEAGQSVTRRIFIQENF